MASANCLHGYKALLSVAMTEADFIPLPHRFPPRLLSIRLDVKYLKINLLRSLERAVGTGIKQGGLLWADFCPWISGGMLLPGMSGMSRTPSGAVSLWQAAGGASPWHPEQFSNKRCCQWLPASLSCQR